MRKLCVILIANLVVHNAMGQENVSDTLYNNEMPLVYLISSNQRILLNVPGSVSIIKSKELKNISPISGNEVFKKIPGIHVVDEEGVGLRMNLGVRGLDPDRSRSVLVMEDGVPVALNPYGEPELYFTPVIDKMNAVEVLKGSGQILFGPQTIGAVVNFITENPPIKEALHVKLKAGSFGYFSANASYGNTIKNTGFLISFLRKQANNIGSTCFTINDFSAKVKIDLNEKSKLGLKFGVYDELSNSTYIGLTQSMYDEGGNDFVRLAPNDQLPVRRYHVSLNHSLQLNQSIKLQTLAYAYSTHRNWQRQDFSSTSTANNTGVIWGNVNIPGAAIFMQNSNAHRNRQFEVVAIESRVKINHTFFALKNEMQFGIRLLQEKALEQFIIGNKADASAGDLRDNEIRKGNALSVYWQNQLQLTKKLSFQNGIRFEQFNYSRNILRGRFKVNNVTVVADTNVLAKSKTSELIPGAGLNYVLSKSVNFFAGIHKGFAPARTKDAITNEGFPLQLDAEISTNYEIGTRFKLKKIITGEITFFVMNFKNQIIPVSQSSGNVNATGNINGGQTIHKGVEAAIEFNVHELMNTNYQLTFQSNVTYVNSKYSSNRYINKSGAIINVLNNKLPYAPNWFLNSSIHFESPKGWGMKLFCNYVSEQFTDELNTLTPSTNGRIGLIESRFILDATTYFAPQGKNFSIQLAVKNLNNQRYISSRRPQGIRVGTPTMITVGVDFKL